MDPETVRTITTPAITAVSTLAGAAIVAYFGYRAQKHTQQQPLSFSSVEATISKSAKFRFVGDEAFKVGDYCDGSTRRSSTKGSVLAFFPEPGRSATAAAAIT